jgi:hypothetical protein
MTTDVSFAEMDVLTRLNSIESKLKEVDPQLGEHMKHIHKTLLAHEELVHILSDEKISVLMAGMQKYKNIQLVEATSKARAPRKGKQTEDDF